jgi:basic amino acid/polyamine antiporter, APA family
MAIQLRRMLGLRTIVSTSAGLAFAAMEYNIAAGLVGYVRGSDVWIATLVAGVIVLIVWASFSELNGMFPTAAAIRLYMEKAMDKRIAFTITFAYMLTIILVIAADAFVIGSSMTFFFGGSQWGASLYILVILGLATFVNLRGIKVAGWIQDIATYTVLLVTVAIVLIGFLRHGFTVPANVHLGGSGGHVQNLFEAVALAVFGYSAFEWVTTSAEEVRSPELIPKGMLLALGMLFIVFSAISIGMSHFLTPAELATPYPQLFLAERCLGSTGILIMMVVTALTAVNTFNGGFITASRFIYATAREGNLPTMFSSMNRHAVPYVAVWTLSLSSLVVAVILALTGGWQVLVAVGAVLETMIYAVACYSVWKLRKRLPNQARPFRAPAVRFIAPFGIAVFTVLAVVAAVTVNNRVSIWPLSITLAGLAFSAVYVILVMPKLRRKYEAQQASRRRRRPQPASPNPILTDDGK